MAHVLIVDDVPDTCMMLARLLKYSGHKADCAFSGEEALAFLGEALPDLLILDQMMPGMDGMEVLRRMRAQPRTANLKVVIFSAITDAAFREHALAKGASDYWTKASIDYGRLGEQINQVLSQDSR